jgi:hypothetical protein
LIRSPDLDEQRAALASIALHPRDAAVAELAPGDPDPEVRRVCTAVSGDPP